MNSLYLYLYSACRRGSFRAETRLMHMLAATRSTCGEIVLRDDRCLCGAILCCASINLQLQHKPIHTPAHNTHSPKPSNNKDLNMLLDEDPAAVRHISLTTATSPTLTVPSSSTNVSPTSPCNLIDPPSLAFTLRYPHSAKHALFV